MTGDPAAFAAAAGALIGSPFRLHGRDPASGLDCVGLVVCALVAIGRTPPPLPHYALRNLRISPFLALLGEAGFADTDRPLRGGDLVLIRPSAGQFHLAIAESCHHLIHAHAGLGLVVRTPAPCQFAAQWHLT